MSKGKMKEKEGITYIDYLLELKEVLVKEFSEDELKEVLMECQETRRDLESYRLLNDEDRTALEVFLAVMRIQAPSVCEQENKKN